MAQTAAWQNRIVGAGEESPDQLLANPRNFRIHPKHQQDALEGVLNEVGWVDDVIVNRRTGFILDGHLRVSLAMRRNEPVPVKYVELTEAEEALILATFDPISAMAATDAALLEELLRDVSTSEPALMQMLSEMAEREGIVPIDQTFDTSPQLGALEYRIVIDCTSEHQQADLLQRFESEGLTCRALMS